MMTREELYQRFKGGFDQAEALQGYVQKLLEPFRLPEERTAYQEICFFFTTKAVRLLSAVVLLCRDGYATEARGLVRTLCQMCIDLHWIGLKEDERASRYIAFFPITRWNSLRGISQGEFDQIPPEKRKRWKTEYQKAAQQFGTDRPEGWAGGIRIDQRASEVGLLPHYNTVFRSGSSFDHTDAHSAVWYFGKGDAKRPAAQLGPSDEDVLLILPTAYTYCAMILSRVDDVLSLHLKAKLEELAGSMKSWRDSQRKSESAQIASPR